MSSFLQFAPAAAVSAEAQAGAEKAEELLVYAQLNGANALIALLIP
jgi:hypothetical protein